MGSLVLFGSIAIIALASADRRHPRVYAITKPLTTLLLLLVAGFPNAQFAFGIALGLILSALGDVTLLRKQRRPYFLAGMGFFVLAHGAYATAFLLGGGSRLTMWTAVAVALAAAGAAAVIRHIWAGIASSLRAPCVIYGMVISTMLGAASTVLPGPWPAATGGAVLAGAVLFYFGDVALALGFFGKPRAYGLTISMALYWSGQLGFALAARWQSGS